MEPTLYHDGRKAYLELHAMRAPLGPYSGAYSEERDPHGDAYNYCVGLAVEAFEHDMGVKVFQLGRSGRHICVEDTPKNRKRYVVLRHAAITAAKEMWAAMQAPAKAKGRG